MQDYSLIPCPFCDSPNVDFFSSFAEPSAKYALDNLGKPIDEFVNVQCISCGAQGPSKIGKKLAAEAWNKRAVRSENIDPEIIDIISNLANSLNCSHCTERKAKAKNIIARFHKKN